MELHQLSALTNSPCTSLLVTRSDMTILPIPLFFKILYTSSNVFTFSIVRLMTQSLITASTESSSTGIKSSMSPFLNSTLLNPCSSARDVALDNIIGKIYPDHLSTILICLEVTNDQHSPA